MSKTKKSPSAVRPVRKPPSRARPTPSRKSARSDPEKAVDATPPASERSPREARPCRRPPAPLSRRDNQRDVRRNRLASPLGARRHCRRPEAQAWIFDRRGKDRRRPGLPHRRARRLNPEASGKAARISSEVRAVAALSLPALRVAWRACWQEDPPRFRSRDLLARATAYRIQAEGLGGEPTALRRRVADLASRFVADRDFRPSAGPDLKPGCTLIREWRGVRHEVAVISTGFLYRGVTYRSLSKVAGEITGTKWNGRTFFGLKTPAGIGR